MLKLYITRHGETEWNVEKRMQGWNNSDLTPKGVEHAIALGNRLGDIHIKSIYSSPSGRAMQTAKLVRGSRNIKIIQDERLKEINLGEWEGKTSAEIEEIDREGIKAFWENPHLYVPKTGESFYTVRDRVSNVINEIIKENENGEVLIVTHAVVVKTIMSIFKGHNVEKLWENPFIHGTGLSIVEVDAKEVRILAEGDLSHVNN